MNSTPASLLHRLRRPNERRAWEHFVELYSPLLFAWARGLGLQDSDAADLVQDAFVLLLNKLPEFHYDSSKSFRAWLKTVFLNKHRERQRANGRFPITGAKIDAVEGNGEIELMEEREYLRYVTHRTLELIRVEFSPAMWQAFQFYAMEERDPVEVAQELKLSPGTVYAAKSRVLHRLRQELQDLVP